MSLNPCPKCNKEISGTTTFCPHCGTTLKSFDSISTSSQDKSFQYGNSEKILESQESALMKTDKNQDSFTHYTTVEVSTKLGMKIVKKIDPTERGIPLEELHVDEDGALKLSILMMVLFAVFLPTYIINSIWFPLLIPFSGVDLEGKACGWLSLQGTDDTSGFGKRKKHVRWVNLIKNKKRFAFKYTLIFIITKYWG